MSSRRSSFRRRQKPPFERFKEHFRHFTAFMFSNVGIILLVVVYIIGGALIFQTIEVFESEANPRKTVEINHTAKCLEGLWNLTANNFSFYDHREFLRNVDEILLQFQRAVVRKQMEGKDAEEKWSFSGAFLYSLTVITTIGYGNISPKSDWGKMVTILYAIIGMPLFLLYLSNIGDVLAKSFKWIYSKVCLCRICPGVARRRIIRERRKMKQMALNKALQDMEEARRSKRRGNSSNSSSSSGSSGSSSGSGASSESMSEEYGEETETSTQTFTELDIYQDDDDTDIEREIRGSTDEITVPLTICIMIMISYIMSGAILFGHWEEWNKLDGSYFCFISLSSIGFGDLVPGDRVITSDKDTVELSFILCSVYLLLGMALIAMCFNLMQEQVIHNMRSFKRAFKACFRCR